MQSLMRSKKHGNMLKLNWQTNSLNHKSWVANTINDLQTWKQRGVIIYKHAETLRAFTVCLTRIPKVFERNILFCYHLFKIGTAKSDLATISSRLTYQTCPHTSVVIVYPKHILCGGPIQWTAFYDVIHLLCKSRAETPNEPDFFLQTSSYINNHIFFGKHFWDFREQHFRVFLLKSVQYIRAPFINLIGNHH